MSSKQHLTMEVKSAVATDAGTFTAIAAAYSTDRQNERIIRGAFKATIARWQASGKMIPLHWDHESDPESIIGVVNPATMRETGEGLEVAGQLDLKDNARARAAWRAMRSDSMSLSFGYLATDAERAPDGVVELKTIDLFEISVVPAPANQDTRFTSMKGISDEGMTEMARIRELMRMEPKANPPETKAAEPDVSGDKFERQYLEHLAGQG